MKTVRKQGGGRIVEILRSAHTRANLKDGVLISEDAWDTIAGEALVRGNGYNLKKKFLPFIISNAELNNVHMHENQILMSLYSENAHFYKPDEYTSSNS